MEQCFLKKRWSGGIVLDDQTFRNIIQPSFCRISLKRPDRIRLPMNTQEDIPCQVTVSVGDYVSKYGIVGARNGKALEDYHVIRSDLPGYVETIGMKQTGYRSSCEYVEIRACRQECEQKNDSWSGWDRNPERMRECLMNSGVPGINRILFDGSTQRKCQIIILNAVMDDASLFYNLLMMRDRPGQMLYGLLVFLRLLDAEKIFIVSGMRQQSAVRKAIESAERLIPAEEQKKITWLQVPDIYPGGRDELMIQNLSEYLDGKIWVILHMDHVLGAYDMIFEQRPWTNRPFLLGGCMPVNGFYELPIGTVLKTVFPVLSTEWMENEGILIDGGLLNGHSMDPGQSVVETDMCSLLILPRIREYEAACSACGQCEHVCPAGLRPFDQNHERDRQLCTGCGCCSFICPSRRRLKEYVVRGGRPVSENQREGYIELKADANWLKPAVETGYSSPYIRMAQSPFTCILSPFQL